ncbi:hypothetical protein DSM110277_02049 [Sulfitobacter pontiacus]|uniref:Uncharacterized protein n=1 Tax=Sulfitobacter pontiacus TaxID=60137 RepID=A0AAX3AD77_9RHOB|nr:hypothetical protein [Sulfitobacter pontiacus]UOA23620.1 hypothetical protein DSM110277_02049 [Sulfitobacter pontiacus]
MMNERLIPFVRGVSLIGHNDPDTLKDAFMNEVIENGGAYADATAVETCLYEISLHGIIARGASEMDAIQKWITAANATLANPAGEEVEADGFITMHLPCSTPRNHAEEIANAMAERDRVKPHAFHRMPFGIS